MIWKIKVKCLKLKIIPVGLLLHIENKIVLVSLSLVLWLSLPQINQEYFLNIKSNEKLSFLNLIGKQTFFFNVTSFGIMNRYVPFLSLRAGERKEQMGLTGRHSKQQNLLTAVFLNEVKKENPNSLLSRRNTPWWKYLGRLKFKTKKKKKI